MHVPLIFLLACNLLDPQSEPAPVVVKEEAPSSPEPDLAEAPPCPFGEQTHQWLDKQYPNIPTAAYVTRWDGEACTVEVPEHKQLYRLTCSESGCEEAGADPAAKEAP
jgi:hypothetical protein